MRFIVLTFLGIGLLVLQAGNVKAQWQVSPVTNYLTEYKDKHQIIRRDVDRRTDLNTQQRLELYDSLMNDLKDRFRQSRKDEYESKSIEISKGHSCTSKSSGGKKDCGYKCAESPDSEDLYTKREWVRVKGTNKGLNVTNGSACLRMTVAGKGKNKGTVFAVFRYKPDKITSNTERDLIELFNLVVS